MATLLDELLKTSVGVIDGGRLVVGAYPPADRCGGAGHARRRLDDLEPLEFAADEAVVNASIDKTGRKNKGQ